MPKIDLDKIEDLLLNALYREQGSASESAHGLRAQAHALEARAQEIEKNAQGAFDAGITALAEKHGHTLGDSAQIAYLRSPGGGSTVEWPDAKPKLLPKKGAAKTETPKADAPKTETPADPHASLAEKSG